MYGKAFCKANLHSPILKSTLGHKLDRSIQQAQSMQTFGIPVGPETSRVVGELIGVGIENQLATGISNFSERSLRYVDDIIVGYDQNENPDSILSEISKALNYFELDMNAEKTEIMGVGETLTPEWIHTLREFRLRQAGQQEIIQQYFKNALYLSDRNPKSNVLGYAVRRSRTFKIDDDSIAYYVDSLLRVGRKSSNTIPAICQILIDLNFKKRPVNKVRVGRFINDIVNIRAPLGHSFEVGWVLFLAKALKIILERKFLEPVFKMDSSISSLICLDLHSRKLIDGGIDISHWQTFNNKDSLENENWLLIYEAILKGWLPKSTPCFVDNHPLFGPMIKKKIKFYNTKRNVKTTESEIKKTIKYQKILGMILTNVEEYF